MLQCAHIFLLKYWFELSVSGWRQVELQHYQKVSEMGLT